MYYLNANISSAIYVYIFSWSIPGCELWKIKEWYLGAMNFRAPEDIAKVAQAVAIMDGIHTAFYFPKWLQRSFSHTRSLTVTSLLLYIVVQ